MKVVVNYVGGNSYTIGNAVEVLTSDDAVIVNTHAHVAGAIIDQEIRILKNDIMYAVVQDGSDLTIIAGRISDFNVMPTTESVRQFNREQEEEDRLKKARETRAERNRVRLAAKHKKEWLAKQQ